jgi:hypothetical protein
MISVRDIQGEWREESTQKVWIVNGIVADRAKRPKSQKMPIVLSDGKDGVEWGNGNLKGNIEDGCLVWRNRRGEATYNWKKIGEPGTTEVQSDPESPVKKGRRTPPLATPPPLPTKTSMKTKTADSAEQSPRSTTSGTSAETAAWLGSLPTADGLPGLRRDSTTSGTSAETAALLGSLPTAPADGQGQDDIAVAEMKMLVEMARQRLMAGDVYMSMRYITLAQQVQPLNLAQ